VVRQGSAKPRSRVQIPSSPQFFQTPLLMRCFNMDHGFILEEGFALLSTLRSPVVASNLPNTPAYGVFFLGSRVQSQSNLIHIDYVDEGGFGCQCRVVCENLHKLCYTCLDNFEQTIESSSPKKAWFGEIQLASQIRVRIRLASFAFFLSAIWLKLSPCTFFTLVVCFNTDRSVCFSLFSSMGSFYGKPRTRD
jgi:hypothetical protein